MLFAPAANGALVATTPLPYRKFMSLIGREIVQALQGGEERTGYGGRQLAELSDIAAAAVRAGVSVTNLKYFRLFFPAYANRSPEIRHKACDESRGCGSRRPGRTVESISGW